MDRLFGALLRGIFHIILTFIIATVIVGAAVEGVFYLTQGKIGGTSFIVALIVGIIIGIIAAFVDLLIELVRGVEKGVQDAENTIGQVVKDAGNAVQHHDQH